MAAININQFNYHSEVLESEKKVLLDFWEIGRAHV